MLHWVKASPVKGEKNRVLEIVSPKPCTRNPETNPRQVRLRSVNASLDGKKNHVPEIVYPKSDIRNPKLEVLLPSVNASRVKGEKNRVPEIVYPEPCTRNPEPNPRQVLPRSVRID